MISYMMAYGLGLKNCYCSTRGFVFFIRCFLYCSNQKEPNFLKVCQMCANFDVQVWNWWIHILHFKYVWNLPTLSLAWFFCFHIEFRPVWVGAYDKGIKKARKCASIINGWSKTHLNNGPLGKEMSNKK